jgi:hypothetical protein
MQIFTAATLRWYLPCLFEVPEYRCEYTLVIFDRLWCLPLCHGPAIWMLAEFITARTFSNAWKPKLIFYELATISFDQIHHKKCLPPAFPGGYQDSGE